MNRVVFQSSVGLICIVVVGAMIGMEFGWKLGVAASCAIWALMPQLR